MLKSQQAIETSALVVRAFVRRRHRLSSHAELSRRLDELEQRYDGHFEVVFDALRERMKPPPLRTNWRIGFTLQRPHRTMSSGGSATPWSQKSVVMSSEGQAGGRATRNSALKSP
jgi:hypothetical protein